MRRGDALANHFLRPLFAHFRRARMQRFAAAMELLPSTTVLDVGGSELNWTYLPFVPKLTILNVLQVDPVCQIPFVRGDGCNLPFRDRSFDVVFSNSAIEHVGSRERQMRFASEIRRVGKAYWVQTPDYRSPIDFHMLLPFFHWLPARTRERLTRNFTPWGWIHRPSCGQVEQAVAEIDLFTAERLQEAFPDAQIFRETVLGLPKALIASRR